ncbi:MAG: NADH-quinone oxidoreductase subunit NuoN [Alphaproteobacteria bacterium]|nr:NADH-quinone oxidoreductase subunit NuoN [Alphaproteobacteria bacterium]
MLAIAGLVLLVGGVMRKGEGMKLISLLTVVAFIGAGYMVLTSGSGKELAFAGAFVSDGFSRFVKIIILAGSVLALLLAQGTFEQRKTARFEFPVLVIFATVGMMLMVSANNFIALYMGLELQSLALYVLAAFERDNARSSEAGLKYFVLGALSSGMLLYGISLVYGFTGSTSFADVATVLTATKMNLGAVFGLVFILAGLAFKVSAVPFHMWTPDVYEGAPTPVTAFLAMAPKAAALALTVRALMTAFPHSAHEWQQIIVFTSILSMGLGAFAAIGQTNIKRLMAYSSIGHMGYALMGLAANSAAGVQSVLIYLTIYIVTTAGAFGCILAMKRDGEPVETISDLAGLSRTQPALAAAFAALMISLSGIPPLAGFWAKFYVWIAAVQAGLWTLAILSALASVVGAFYYWRIFKTMYFDEPAPAFDGDVDRSVSGIVAGSVILNLAFLIPIVGAPLIAAAAEAAKALMP